MRVVSRATLGAERILDDLHRNFLTVMQQIANVGLVVGFTFCGGPVRRDIGSMQKRRAFDTDVDKGRLHAGQHALHLAHIDIAGQTAARGALDQQFLEHTVLQQRDPGFARRMIDQDFFRHIGYIR